MLGIGGVLVAGHATDDTSGQSARPVTVSAQHLAINQRISQAAVRRANESVKLLGPVRPVPRTPAMPLGWASDLSADMRERQPRWAVVAPGDTVLQDRVPTLGIDPADPAVITVRILQASNPANSEDAPFHLTVTC